MKFIDTIHAEIWTNEGFVSLSPYARLLFIGLALKAPEDGSFEWRPLSFKIQFFPADTIDIESALFALVAAGCAVKSIDSEGREFGRLQLPV